MTSHARGSLLRSVFGEGSIYQTLDNPIVDEEDDVEANQGNVYQPRAYFRDEMASDSADAEDGPPTSLLMEGNPRFPPQRGVESRRRGGPTPPTQASLNNSRANLESGMKGLSGSMRTHLRTMDPRERALWMWANIENLDNFLMDIYSFFLGNGMYAIILTRILNMLTLLFVIGFSTYLGSCIDYSTLSESHKLSEVQVPNCMARLGTFHKLVLWLVALFWFLKLFQYIRDIKRLADLRNFFRYALDIPDSDMQTVSWQQVVSRLMKLKDANLATANVDHPDLGAQSKQRIDPHVIANRIMRKENYLIAMYNKDVLDLRIPIPWANSQFLTRTLEWHISLCIMDYAFNAQGLLRPVFLRESHRRILADGLRRRFLFAGVMNIVFAPFIILYLALLYFFRYFNEYHKDPSAIGTRQYTPLAEWKMREFNELFHLFRGRINRSYEPAARYVNQFPREMTATVARFVTFVAGSFAAVLGIVSLVDPELFLGFEITPDRTVLFYLGVFGTVVAVGRGLIPDDNVVFDPESSLRSVCEHTHYLPAEWEGQLHSTKVRADFIKLYDLKIMIILKELASVIIAPFILWFSLPKCSDRVIDFFRDFSVHVDGVGYVCSFAVFNFDNALPVNKPAVTRDELRGTYFTSSDGKMLKSYLNFIDNYGTSYDEEDKNRGKKRPQYNDMDKSVMGRYQHMRLRPSTDPSSNSRTPTNESAQGNMTDSLLPMSDNLDSRTGDEGSNNAVDRGVLGLINEFYQQVGTGNTYNRM